ncbi:MAG TPA: hypothetical protein VMV81_13070, partial [Phycisphaerae bacterium]|nr:hypothetical protein [Phycisphaerae bacterium]
MSGPTVRSSGVNLTQIPTDYYKFCPGEEHVKISNAICRGRRRASYPKCPGCQFNDEGAPLGTITGVNSASATTALEGIFRANEICGVAPVPLSADAAWRVGHAAGQFLHGRLRGFERASPGSRSVVVGRDMRPTSQMLQSALIEGVRSVGMDVINIGVVDLPQLYFAVNQFHACGGIQTTGGVMAAEYNGFKLCGAKGAPIGDETGLAGIRDIALRVPRHQTAMAARLREADVSAEYGAFVRGAIAGEKVKNPIKIFVDAGHGPAGRWMPEIFEEAGPLKIEVMNGEGGTPYAHNPDPCDPRCTQELRRRVKEGGADFGVAFSGDAGRCAFIDEKGMAVSADVIAALLARGYLEQQRGSSVVLDVRSSMAASDEIQRAGGSVVRERVGYMHMRKTMGESGAVIGADWSGRFYFRMADGCESALLAVAHVIGLLNATGRRLGELAQGVVKLRSSGEVICPCPSPEIAVRRLVEQFPGATVAEIDGVTIRYEDWWFNARPIMGDKMG